MLFLLNYVSINKKKINSAYITWCILCISFGKTIYESSIGEWLERPTARTKIDLGLTHGPCPMARKITRS